MKERTMSVMRAIDSGPDVPSCIIDFDGANQALENLKCALANLGCYEEAFRVSELLRELYRTRQHYVDDHIL
jgi:hypothetical protein